VEEPQAVGLGFFCLPASGGNAVSFLPADESDDFGGHVLHDLVRKPGYQLLSSLAPVPGASAVATLSRHPKQSLEFGPIAAA
jgi:hypothetical protein